MRRALLLIYIICSLTLLSGCGRSMFSSRRDMEHLRPVQTMGLDREGGTVRMSVSTGPGPEEEPALVMTARAAGLEDAAAALQDYAPRDELFYAHVRYILLGPSMTDDSILPLLDWVERSPAMRMDTPLLVSSGTAADAVTGVYGQGGDVTARLDALEREERFRGRTLTNLRDTAAGLMEQGGALCSAVSPAPSGEPGEGAALLPAGYAVLRRGERAEFLTEEESLGSALLLGQINGARVRLGGDVLDLTGADVHGELRREGEEPAGLTLTCSVQAGIVERGRGETDPGRLTEDLCRAAEGWLTAAVARAQTLGCDYLGLRDRVLSPWEETDGEAWNGIFSRLPVAVTAEAVIDRSYDLSP